MIKRITSFILKDIASAGRDNIILYMLLAPILIAVVMALVIPSADTSPVTFAVDSNIDKTIVTNIEDYGKIETFASRQQVAARVGGHDDAVGITEENGHTVIILEGNEREEIAEIAYMVIWDITREGAPADFSYTNLGDNRSLLKEYTAIILILMVILVAGMVMGFNIIDEKESGAIRAIAITPLRLWQYLAARGILVLGFSLLLTAITSLILLGAGFSFLKLMAGTIFSSGMGILLGLVIGGAADNQIKGIALIKVTAFPFTIIPVAAIFIPERFEPFLYPFPNYWIYRVFKNVFITNQNTADFWLACMLAFLITVILLVISVVSFKKKMKLR
ncbi:MAG: ABC transporter permease [Actinomycetota bacterium]